MSLEEREGTGVSADAAASGTGPHSPVINPAAIEPLYAPYEEPLRHRIKAKTKGDPAQIVTGRRPSPIPVAQNLRASVGAWRKSDYPGASDTTRELLHHWFERDHETETKDGEKTEFRYYFCQREAIETLIYLYEVRGIRTLSNMVAEFLGDDTLTAALGVHPDEDRWSKYAFKLATGAGKTKVMTLAIVWSYFHSLWEEDSPLAQNFVIIAPNLTVFERLKDDFANGKIFDEDPLIPTEWRGDWNLSVVLQDEASGASTGGTLYLTNIHRLYDYSGRRTKTEAETYDWLGPAVSRAKALDTGEVLRDRVTSHRKIMVLNDEAHHLWDPGSAWNEAIEYLHEAINDKTNGGIVAQLDFSATPKDNHGRLFQHVICDAPLGEAVDSGIVKTPVIGRSENLIERASDDASERYQQHLMIGYERWRKSKEEWDPVGKNALMFVMTEDTEAANQIAHTLNTSSLFSEFNGKTLNLHTRLKGKIKWIGGRKKGYPVFEESEKDIKDEDLEALREISRDLDSGKSPYRCIVSVLMLREGWDVRNVTTIVPLRPFTSTAKILPEQTIGRGLRRMTYAGGPNEILTVVEHPSFVTLYQEELSQEGLPIIDLPPDEIPKTTVTIYPDAANKDLHKLDLVIPDVTSGYDRTATLEGLTIDEVRTSFSRYSPLPLGEASSEDIRYEGRHLLTDEIVEQMNIQLPLLESGVGAISFYREELERMTQLRGLHATLAPLLETFLTEILFEERVDLFDPRLISRLGNPDVREHIRAVFLPLIRSKTTHKSERRAQGSGVSVTTWKPFQATQSERHPTIQANKTPFNLVPCNRNLEAETGHFLDIAPEVAAFCKNAGPQALRIDYMGSGGRLALYTPDFIIRLKDGSYILMETKGLVDRDVPSKVNAASSWCGIASESGTGWRYLYVQEDIFEDFNSDSIEMLERLCAPITQNLVSEVAEEQLTLPVGEVNHEKDDLTEFISAEDFADLPQSYQKRIQQAVVLLRFHEEREEDFSFSPVFNSLLFPLDEAARGLIVSALGDKVPDDPRLRQRFFFFFYLSNLPRGAAGFHQRQGDNLRRTLQEGDGLMPIGLLKWCLEYARSPKVSPSGVFLAIKTHFAEIAKTDLLDLIDRVYTFRNECVAHQDKEIKDAKTARVALKEWISLLLWIWGLSEPINREKNSGE